MGPNDIPAEANYLTATSGDIKDFTDSAAALNIEKETDSKPIDIIFLIDTTGSMSDDIDSVKSSATEIVEALDSKKCDYRVCMADYRDYPMSPYGEPGLDYVYNLDLPFSNNKDVIINSINGLSLGNGADEEESVYSALVNAISDSNKDSSNKDNYGWRKGVTKCIILMGDAPPHIPEPWSGGQSLDDVVYWSKHVDPVAVYSIRIGSDSSTYSEFSEISNSTGGKVYTADNADDLVDTILKVIEDIDNTPPESISNLNLESKASTWINWTWTNPSDPDFSHTEVYLNGIFQADTSVEYFNATGLEPETSYTLGTRTVDNSGNVNQTWVNSTATTDKEVTMLPVANFSSNVSEGSVPLSVQFTDLSENATSWNWDFGDRATSTEQNPVHTYSKVGKYTVSLTVENAAGNNSTLKSSYINVVPLKVPVAAFSASPTFGKAPLTVNFTDKSTGFPTSWKWTFGDGNTSTEKNPVHTYSNAGLYPIKLTVKNAKGSSTASKLKYISIANPFSTVPTAAFSASPTSGKAPLTVNFSDKSTGSPASWTWTFGDGTSSTEQNPVHTYSEVGQYTVKLKVKNLAGSSTKILSKYVVVSKT